MSGERGGHRAADAVGARSLPALAALAGVVAALAAGMVSVDRAAASPAGSWQVEPVMPTYFIPGRASSLAVVATDTAPAGEVTIDDRLPAGVEAKSVMFNWSAFGLSTDLNGLLPICSTVGQDVTCHLAVSEFGLAFEPGQIVRAVIQLAVPASAHEGPVINEAVVEGGGIAAASASTTGAIRSHPPFGIAHYTLEPTAATKVVALGGEAYEVANEPYAQPFTQAGGHPWALTTKFEFATEAPEADSDTGEMKLLPTHDPKDIIGNLPPGLLGDPMAVPRCPLSLVTAATSEQCPGSTQIGVFRIHFEAQHELLGPIVNVTPEAGQSAEFALEAHAKGVITPLLTAHLVRTSEGYGFDVADNGVPAIGLRSVELTFWGVPADPSHDSLRGSFCGRSYANLPMVCGPTGGEHADQPLVPFLSFPTDCAAGPQRTTLRADSWEEPGSVTGGGQYSGYSELAAPFPAVTGCGLLQFNAGTGIAVQPDTQTADEPVGLDVGLKIPLNETPGTNATPQLRRTLVTLPEGMSVSPGVVDGIRACRASGPEGINITGPESEEVGLSGELQLAPGHCPDASIVGTAEAVTPFLPTPVKGHVYLADPGCGGAGQSPCSEEDVRDGNLYKLYLELGGTGQFADTGIEFKVPLETEVNPATGQLTAVSDGLVQAPYSEVRVHLNGGPRAPLANPAVCGPALTTADFAPWSAPGLTPEGLSVPGTGDVLSSSFFDVTGCAGVPPFNPGFAAGTVTPQAGQFSSFTMNLARQDREQYVKGIQLHTPPGLLGILASVPLCGEAQANEPSVYGECPGSSKIGTTRVATGAGSHPFEIEGDVYLTGPYRGAPFGLSIVTHAVAGPFNLGLVVVRARIDVDPETSELTVTTDESGRYALPQIVFGVPLRLRRITVDIDRPGFMINPTSCGALQVSATIAGNQNATASVSSPFAVGGCRSLAFKPSFTASTSARASRVNGADLDVKLFYPAGSLGEEANIRSVKVALPRQLPSRLTTLQKACPAATFEADAAGCPAASIVGAVRASTPLLPVPLSGPAYFVSHGGEAFPSLIVVLQGDGVRVDLTGSTFISKQGITSSTFKTVPDVPVSTFELYLPQGRYSALSAVGNLCTAKLTMPTEFTAQSGTVLRQSTRIAVTGCAKHKRRARQAAAHHARVVRAHRARAGGARAGTHTTAEQKGRAGR